MFRIIAISLGLVSLSSLGGVALSKGHDALFDAPSLSAPVDAGVPTAPVVARRVVPPTEPLFVTGPGVPEPIEIAAADDDARPVARPVFAPAETLMEIAPDTTPRSRIVLPFPTEFSLGRNAGHDADNTPVRSMTQRGQRAAPRRSEDPQPRYLIGVYR